METYLIIECNSSPLSFPFFSIHINYKHLNLHKIVLVKQKKGKKSIYLFAKREVSLSLSIYIYIYKTLKVITNFTTKLMWQLMDVIVATWTT